MNDRYLHGDLIDVFVKPFYIEVLHGSFSRQPLARRLGFARRIIRVLPGLNEYVLDQLFRGGWRETLCASFYVGVQRLDSYCGLVGQYLVLSMQPYSGQMHTFALARIGSLQAIEFLQLYLRTWLPRSECRYDQYWAMAALCVLDERRSTEYASEFLVSGGLWAQFARGLDSTNMIEERIKQFRELLDAADAIEELYRSQPTGTRISGIATTLVGRELPLRSAPDGTRRVAMGLQRALIRLLYKCGVTGDSRFFPVLLRVLRCGPLGYYVLPYSRWVVKFGTGLPQMKSEE